MDAVGAATKVAEGFGIPVAEPTVLSATNNTVILLSPSLVVAKVATGHHGRLKQELELAGELEGVGAPVVEPSRLPPAVVHRLDDWEVTFWPYHPQDSIDEPGPAALAQALEALHEALDHLSDARRSAVPGWGEELDGLVRRLNDSSFAPSLAAGDRDLLQAVLARHPHVDEASARTGVLHGSPHRHNILVVDGRPRFIDFETVCSGPVEWDLAHLDSEVALSYRPGYDAEALDVARLMVSAKTAAWCWNGIDRGDDMRFHAEHHLAVVRAAAG